LLALNIAAFPEEFPETVITAILGAASDVVRSAGGSIAGGHTIRSTEPIFGLAVQGVVHPDRMWSKAGARPDDALVLSKPIGSGIVLAGGDSEQKSRAVAVMRSLNDRAAADLHDVEETGRVHAVTDVTGFGLAGHSWEISERSGVGVQLFSSCIPSYEGAVDLAEQGVRTGGHQRNQAYLGDRLTSKVSDPLVALVLDPQTSGGLLACVDRSCVELLASRGWSVVGRTLPGEPRVELLEGPIS
jgi:selenide,water dikinase